MKSLEIFIRLLALLIDFAVFIMEQREDAAVTAVASRRGVSPTDAASGPGAPSAIDMLERDETYQRFSYALAVLRDLRRELDSLDTSDK